MDDEIKEILDYLQDKDNYIEELGVAYKRIYINNGDLNLLLDYITNLDEKNKELKKKITFNEKSRRKMQQSLMEQTEDYKSRIEKAVEYMNNTFDISSVKDMFDIMNKLEDILNGKE